MSLKYYVLMVLIMTNLVSATQYYVSNGGSDASDGLTMGASWLTLDKVDSTSFSSGDVVSFRKGDIWRETMALNSEGVTYNSYGNGTKPKFLFSVNATNTSCWTDLTGNKWAYTCNLTHQARTFFYNTSGDFYYGNKETDIANVNANYDYFANATRYLIVYSDLGNPATYFNGIEIPNTYGTYGEWTYGGWASQGSGDKHTKIDGLEFRYYGGYNGDSCMVAFIQGDDFNITNSDFKGSYHKGLC